MLAAAAVLMAFVLRRSHVRELELELASGAPAPVAV
jgi:hypothetical protein